MGPSIYLGVQGYGCACAEDKDRFAHRFRQADSVCCYAVCDKGRYAIQNRLQEGHAYHLTIRQGTVIQAILSRPDAQGVIHAVSGNSITVDGMHLPCRAVFEIRTRAGGAVVLPCFLTGRIVGSYAQVFGGAAYIRPAPRMYHPPVHGIPGRRTMQNLLRTALMPVGTALYVYGGGWNWQDTGSGNTAMHIGLPQSWIDFFDCQNACYTYRSDSNPAHSYYPTGGWNQYGYAGLDCSGYLGWTLYNTLHTESASVSDCDGYVTPAAEFAHTLAQRAWGTLSRQAATACRSRPRSIPAISSAWTVICGCASVPAETAALSSRTLRPRPVKPIVKAAACSSARSIPRVMRIRTVRRIGLQNALCSGIRAGVQGIRCICCPIRFMGSCRRIRIQGCSGGMIFSQIKKVFGNSLRRRFCKLRIENGELRDGIIFHLFIIKG